MDLANRKLNLIAFLAQIKDEVLFSKLENYILKSTSQNELDLKPFSKEELVSRINKSESDFINGRVKSQEELEKVSAEW